MKIRHLLCLSFVAAALAAAPLAYLAQDPALTLENIYSKRAFGQRGFGPVRGLKDTKEYSTVE